MTDLEVILMFSITPISALLIAAWVMRDHRKLMRKVDQRVADRRRSAS